MWQLSDNDMFVIVCQIRHTVSNIWMLSDIVYVMSSMRHIISMSHLYDYRQSCRCSSSSCCSSLRTADNPLVIVMVMKLEILSCALLSIEYECYWWLQSNIVVMLQAAVTLMVIYMFGVIRVAVRSYSHRLRHVHVKMTRSDLIAVTVDHCQSLSSRDDEIVTVASE
jgi:hypothetical protein